MAAVTAEAVREAVRNVYFFRYINVATGSILVYDYCLTFSQEVSFVWISQWSAITFLYLLTRYLPFFDTGLILFHQFWTGLGTNEVCLLAYRLDAFLLVIGIGISEIILMIRIWVVWEKDRRIAITLAVLFLMTWIGIFLFTWYFLQSLRFVSLPIPEFLGCHSTDNSTLLIMDWVLFMMFEIVMLGLILIKSIRTYSFSRNMPLFRVVYRDGILFYIYIVGISASNVIVIVALPDMALLLTPLGRVMHSVLTARFVLELRQELNKNQDEPIELVVAARGGSVCDAVKSEDSGLNVPLSPA